MLKDSSSDKHSELLKALRAPHSPYKKVGVLREFHNTAATVIEELQRELAARSHEAATTPRCKTTGNPCGTDTVFAGQECPGGGPCTQRSSTRLTSDPEIRWVNSVDGVCGHPTVFDLIEDAERQIAADPDFIWGEDVRINQVPHVKVLLAPSATVTPENDLIYVPGLLRCKKCKFELSKRVLNMAAGSITANNEPDKCPNDGSPMWRVSEREYREELFDHMLRIRNETLDFAARVCRDLIDKQNKRGRLQAAAILEEASKELQGRKTESVATDGKANG